MILLSVILKTPIKLIESFQPEYYEYPKLTLKINEDLYYSPVLLLYL